MSRLNWKRVGALYERAAAIEDPEKREAFLNAECSGEPEVYKKLEEMLRCAGQPDEGFLDRLSKHVAESMRATFELAPGCRLLGRYTVVERMAVGGMAEIYRAREDGFDRDLAIKVIHAELHGIPEAESRFLTEARLTGQLQHPNIVPVHAMGRLESGRLYFTLKLVMGRTLEATLAAEHPPEEAGEKLTRLLEIFERMCEALELAHSEGVVHRDLKPSNVMVGAFGEVQLMDWGIAKILRPRPDDRPAELHPDVALARQADGGRVIGMTEAGRVLGTLAYIAPEQARGEVDRIGPATDVFGLGAILCEILTGAPPYRWESPDAASTTVALNRVANPDLSEVIRRLKDSRKPGRLIDLATACLAVDPGHRPADAAAVRKQLRDHFDVERREAEQAKVDTAAAEARANAERRRRRLAHVLAWSFGLFLLAAAGAAVLFQRQAKANFELAEKEKSARLAEEKAHEAEVEQRNLLLLSLKEVIFDIQAELVHQPGVLKLRQKLLEKAMGRLRQVAQSLEAAGQVSHGMAWAHLELGDTFAELGYTNEAHQQYYAAYKVVKALAEAQPQSPYASRYLALCSLRLGDISRRLGDTKEASVRFQEALNRYKALVESDPKDVEAQNMLKESYRKVGELHIILGNPLKAREAFEEAFKLCQTMVAVSPTSVLARWRQADAHAHLAQLRFPDQPDKVITESNKALSLFEALAREDLTKVSTRDDAMVTPSLVEHGIMRAHGLIGDAELLMGNPSEALDAFRKAFTAARKLADDNPGNRRAEHDLSVAHEKMGDVLLGMGKTGEAKREYEASLEFARKLAAGDPSNTEAQRRLAVAYIKLGEAHMQSDPIQLKAVGAAYDNGLDLLQALHKMDRDDMLIKHLLSVVELQRGEVYRLQKNTPAARKLFLDAKKLREELARENPDSVECRTDLVSCYANLGELDQEDGRSKEAVGWYSKALDILEKLAADGKAADRPRLVEWKHVLQDRIDRLSQE